MKLTAERLSYIIELGNNPEIVNLIREHDSGLLLRLIRSYKEIQAQINTQADSTDKEI